LKKLSALRAPLKNEIFGIFSVEKSDFSQNQTCSRFAKLQISILIIITWISFFRKKQKVNSNGPQCMIKTLPALDNSRVST
jgi:hypothetical protein